MKKRTRRVGGCFLILAGLLVTAVLFHSLFLRTASRWWIVDTTPANPVEAIIVPGGGLETRPFGAARLYHDGVAEKIILFATEVLPSEKLGLKRPGHEVAFEVLEKLDVPPESIEVIHEAVTSTHDEVIAVRDWASARKVSSLVIVTDVFPSRRVNRAYLRGLSDLEVDIHVHTVPARLYDSDTWWENEHGLIAFQNEVIKYFYYLFRY